MLTSDVDLTGSPRCVDEARAPSCRASWTLGIRHDLPRPSHCPDVQLGSLVGRSRFTTILISAACVLALSACLGEAQIEQTPANQAINCPGPKAVYFADLHLPAVFTQAAQCVVLYTRPGNPRWLVLRRQKQVCACVRRCTCGLHTSSGCRTQTILVLHLQVPRDCTQTYFLFAARGGFRGSGL